MQLTNRPFEQSIGRRDLTHWRTPVGRLLARAVMRASRWTTWRWLSIVLTLGGAMVVGSAAYAAAAVYESVEDGRDGFGPWDRPLLTWSVDHRPADVARAITWFTAIGGPVVTPVVAVVVLAVMTWRWRTPTPAVLGLLAGVGSLAITIAGKAAVGRDRPPLAEAVPPYEHSFSFPSGHATNAVVVAGIIAYLLLTRATRASTRAVIVTVAVLYALGIGASRVYLGHHWASDVMAGWAIGAAWLAMVITGHRLHLTHHRYHAEIAAGEDPPALEPRSGDGESGIRPVG
ncbi:phosphatase PAP2 family protein [Aestuariimicrobium soli]|uniref:phosphatase PAP2 family protein n=1 Tax=Aestuariimicrobium soli TaxID=2035834 RepID=UPI003EBCA586